MPGLCRKLQSLAGLVMKMFELDDYHCPNKGCPGIYRDGFKHRAMLEYIKLHDFYQCPECGTEIWEPPDRSDGRVSKREARSVYRAELRYKNAIMSHKGGSKKAGRKRKQKQKFYPPPRVLE